MPAIVNVIQFEGSPEQLVWKSPIEDFNSSSQLIVDESHEAIVLIEGRAELFGPGRHTLKTENYFGLNAIQRFATGGDTPFPCKVYFVNKVHAMDMQWGTQDPLMVNDPELDIFLHLKLHGSLSYVIDNSLKFVEKFTGFTREFSPEETMKKFRGIISVEVTDLISKVINEAKVGYLTINSRLKDISQMLMNPMSVAFEDYGIRLVYFNMETITSREEDLAEVQAAKSARRATVIAAQGAAESRQIQGYDWLAEKKAEILTALASNDGSMGGMMGAGIGLVAAGPMGQNLTSVVDDFFDPNKYKNNQADPFGGMSQAGSGMPQPFGFQQNQPFGFQQDATMGQPDSIEPVAPVEQAQSIEPVVPIEPVDPVIPAQPAEPIAPAQPIEEPAPIQQPQEETAAIPESAKPLTKAEFIARVSELKELLELGVIDQSDFDQGKKDLLARFTQN